MRGCAAALRCASALAAPLRVRGGTRSHSFAAAVAAGMQPPAGQPAKRVAVVGGGVAGLAAADALLRRGVAVTLFDMGHRGPGGRASTRRTPQGFEFDHGAQFVLLPRGSAPPDDPAAALFRELAQAGALAPWAARLGALQLPGGAFTPRDAAAESAADSFFGFAGGDVFVGAPSGDALVAYLARERPGLTRAFGTRVTRVAHDGVTWHLEGVAGPSAARDAPPQPLGVFDALVAADASLARAGAPGATSLAEPEAAARLPGGVAAAAAAMAAVPRTPLFTVMAALPRALPEVPLDGAVVRGCAHVAFLARQSSKPGRAPPPAPHAAAECWVAVSTPAFAAEALAQQRAGAATADDVAAALWRHAAAALAAAAGVSAQALPAPVFLAAQRWGAATTAHPLAAPCLGDASARFAACGDWAAGGGGLAAAARSGAAAARLVADALQAKL